MFECLGAVESQSGLNSVNLVNMQKVNKKRRLKNQESRVLREGDQMEKATTRDY